MIFPARNLMKPPLSSGISHAFPTIFHGFGRFRETGHVKWNALRFTAFAVSSSWSTSPSGWVKEVEDGVRWWGSTPPSMNGSWCVLRREWMGCWGCWDFIMIVSEWKGSKIGSVKGFFLGRASRNDVWRPSSGWKMVAKMVHTRRFASEPASLGQFLE